MPAVKPMLAATYGEDVLELRYPVLVSPKIDGIRGLIVNGVVQARSGDPIKHPLVQEMFGRAELNGLDGELAIGPINARDLMQRTQAVNGKTREIDPDELTFNVFDIHDMEGPYVARLLEVIHRLKGIQLPGVHFVVHRLARHEQRFQESEQEWVEAGFEGLMVNVPGAPYKHGGRCGKKEPWLIKVKRFVDDECVVLGLIEQQHNANELQRDELGRAYRSTAKAGMVGAGTLGKMNVRALTGMFSGVEFELGCGTMNHATRKQIYDNPSLALGKQVTFKHFHAAGTKDKPRFPIFKSFREPGT